jgi:hypothetical protein
MEATMPFDGSGNFNRVMNWVNDSLAHIKVLSSRHDQEDDNFASGLSNTLTKDGQSQPTADIPLNGHKLVNVANPTNPQDAATKNYADAVRAFSTGLTLTGTSTGTSPNFVSTAYVGFTEADLSIVARKADNSVTPPTVDRLMLNSTANGTGPDIGPLATQTAQSLNRIVNGAMQVSQENGSTGSTANGFWPADQWVFTNTAAGAVVSTGRAVSTISPQVDFARNRLTVTVTTAKATLLTTEVVNINQRIEGINIADFNWGLPTAKQVVLRFGFRTNVAGTFSVSLRNVVSGVPDRSYVAPMVISPAEAAAQVDVWKTFVIPGDTAGTWAADNTAGLQLGVTMAGGPGTFAPSANQWVGGNFQCAPGASNGIAAVNNYMQVSNVGLYLDPDNTGVPPPWDVRDYGQELAACMRYWQTMGGNGNMFSGNVTSGSSYFASRMLPVQMRIPPTLSGVSTAAASFPNTTGSLAATSVGNSGWSENRIANATGPGQFQSTIICNARI